MNWIAICPRGRRKERAAAELKRNLLVRHPIICQVFWAEAAERCNDALTSSGGVYEF